jgi:hypothetical protein
MTIMLIRRRILPVVVFAAALIFIVGYAAKSISMHAQQPDFNAQEPEKSGYRLIFQDDFTDPSTIDIHDTRKEGFKWYMGKFHWSGFSLPEQVVLGRDGLVLSGRIATATSSFDDQSMIGKAWGGTLYFEAMINLDPTHVFSWKDQGPAFWGLSWAWSNRAAQAPTMVEGYEHFGELDFMEYGFANKPGSAPDLTHYSQSVHDWYGIDHSTCKPDAYCEVLNEDRVLKVPDIRGWHRFGTLQVVSKDGKSSYVQPYYDGKAVGYPRKWPAFRELKDVPVPPTSENSYSILDFEKWIVVLTATKTTPITVRYVKIWRSEGDRLPN